MRQLADLTPFSIGFSAPTALGASPIMNSPVARFTSSSAVGSGVSTASSAVSSGVSATSSAVDSVVSTTSSAVVSSASSSHATQNSQKTAMGDSTGNESDLSMSMTDVHDAPDDRTSVASGVAQKTIPQNSTSSSSSSNTSLCKTIANEQALAQANDALPKSTRGSNVSLIKSEPSLGFDFGYANDLSLLNLVSYSAQKTDKIERNPQQQNSVPTNASGNPKSPKKGTSLRLTDISPNLTIASAPKFMIALLKSMDDVAPNAVSSPNSQVSLNSQASLNSDVLPKSTASPISQASPNSVAALDSTASPNSEASPSSVGGNGAQSPLPNAVPIVPSENDVSMCDDAMDIDAAGVCCALRCILFLLFVDLHLLNTKLRRTFSAIMMRHRTVFKEVPLFALESAFLSSF